MICLPNAKINLGLYVLDQRPDGMHNLETAFMPIPLQDSLEIQPFKSKEEKYDLVLSGLPVEGEPGKNLVVKVFLQLQEEFKLPPQTIYLCKKIPTGAGLGGGSSDAAFMMQLLNERFKLELTPEEMKARLVGIGADVPFFVDDRPMFATGIGDQLEPLDLDLSDKWLVLVKPQCSVSTREAYANVPMRQSAPLDLRQALKQPVEEWRGWVENDFEQSVFPNYPQIAAIKQTLYDMKALYAAMSGSGSAVFGIFDFKFLDPRTVFHDCFVYQSSLKVYRPTFI